MTDGVGTYVVEELLADQATLTGHRRTEHHGLLVVQRHSENLLHVCAHVHLCKHLIALIHHKVLDLTVVKNLVSAQSFDATRATDDDIRILHHNLIFLSSQRDTTEHRHDHHIRQIHSKPLKLLRNLRARTYTLLIHKDTHTGGVTHLKCQFASVAEHNGGDDVRRWTNLVENGDDEDGSFAHAALRLTDQVAAQQRLGDAFMLHCVQRSLPCGFRRTAYLRTDVRNRSRARRDKLLCST